MRVYLCVGVLLFSLSVTTDAVRCGDRLKACSCKHKQKTFSSPQYKNNVDCRWTISTESSKKQVQLQISSIALEDSPDCVADYIEVFDGSSRTASSLGRWCGYKTFNVSSSGSTMLVVYHTDHKIPSKGFTAIYTAKRTSGNLPLWAILLLALGLPAVLIVGFIVLLVKCGGQETGNSGRRFYGGGFSGGGGGGCGGGGGGCGGGGGGC